MANAGLIDKQFTFSLQLRDWREFSRQLPGMLGDALLIRNGKHRGS
jgi:hypothetical protein